MDIYGGNLHYRLVGMYIVDNRKLAFKYKAVRRMNGNDEVKAVINELKAYLEFQARVGNGKIMIEKETAQTPVRAKAAGKQKEAAAQKIPQTEKTNPAVTVSQFSDLFESGGEKSLEEIRKELGDCERCKLHSGRRTIVFGEGNPKAELVFVGEGPGRDEDEQGRPFVGRGGKLLDKIIEAMGMKREDVYICNVVKCRPPENRNPEADEAAECEPFLVNQIKSVSPRVIVCLGLVAAKALLKLQNPSLGSLRGVFHNYGGIKLAVTYHPAALLRFEKYKRPLWDDMKMVVAELKENPRP